MAGGRGRETPLVAKLTCSTPHPTLSKQGNQIGKRTTCFLWLTSTRLLGCRYLEISEQLRMALSMRRQPSMHYSPAQKKHATLQSCCSSGINPAYTSSASRCTAEVAGTCNGTNNEMRDDARSQGWTDGQRGCQWGPCRLPGIEQRSRRMKAWRGGRS